MGLLILGFIGFIVATLIALAWAVVWIAFALFWLVWPLVLLVVAGIAWRRQARGWQRAQTTSPRAPQHESAVSGNAAYDAYRAETLQRLDEERAHFGAFLERLRKAKDKEAFDSYMAERRGGGGHIEDMRGASA
jgi:biopolymer transport protein ExbB/TolQ